MPMLFLALLALTGTTSQPIGGAALVASLSAGKGQELSEASWAIPPRFWGPTGHRVVARIAAARLSSKAKNEVDRLLGGESLADASSWADQIRARRPETARWHYVDISVLDSVYHASKVCPTTCVVKVIDSLTPILSDRTRPRAQRADALRFLIHFIGDLHQPLHASDRGDRGGNDVKVRFLGRQYTLHAVWDSRLIDAMGVNEDDLVADLLGRIAKRSDLATLTKGSTIDWAMESHDIARDFIYRTLPNSLVLGPGDLARARPVVEECLLRGGVRLAAVLEKALGQ